MTVKEWETYERKYCIDSDNNTFRKTEIPSNTNLYGKQTTPWKSAARIKNEYQTLRFIKTHTTIPVPEALSIENRDGCWSVLTEYVDGIPLDDLPDNIRPAAVKKAQEFIEQVVLPQLSRLRSRVNGTLSGEVIPPRRVADMFPNTEWMGDVVSIIDWEYAGYYHQCFEGALWLKPHTETTHSETETAFLASKLVPDIALLSGKLTPDLCGSSPERQGKQDV
ncbi:hypothetical protein A1O3_07650 [Capronia epimyces CBS 606.96]|uniref:Aminoglycoside phosphotransferase domain-containing protein n=1 Tax=Capronia epimyces CBS 606.96 TaxID=1182542 RepID=W9YGG5_9EURO|nr:uncharacterized protein A1O3_07650 [Capronia epimyces CBS 606.96]EXJ81359.1 hypothetical protein A1O3_07650 [Capronia epimyces CBS 606.96]